MRLPVLGVIKKGTDPLLSWLPVWAHAVVWAFLAGLLIYALLYGLIKHALPWLAANLDGPAYRLAELGGALLLLPEYLSTKVLRQVDRAVPGAVFGYDDAVQGLVRGSQRLAGAILAATRRLRGVPKLAILVLLVVLAIGWNGSYCVGQDADCVVPTAEWVHSVSKALQSRQPAHPKPCPTKKKKRHGAKKPAGCGTSGG